MSIDPDDYYEALRRVGGRKAARAGESGRRLWLRTFGRLVFGFVVFGGGTVLTVWLAVVAVYSAANWLSSLTH